ncbi:TRAFAC clade GTPase domain-containing protein [Streptosporangium sp. H16]|uniref:TRAFAC clade GTPase domain-containing protein n=1 Tax=Streptosporangium sp. H16 TaxID=3444184 RepID=UPI003F78F419
MGSVVAMLFGLFAWMLGVWLATLAGVVLFPVALLVTTAVLVGLYCVQASAILLPDTAYGPSPVSRPGGDHRRDPAYRHYLASQVWQDWRSIIRLASSRMSAGAARGLSRSTAILLGGKQGWVLFPIWLGVCGGIVSATLPVAVTVLLIATAYLATVATGLLAWLVCVGVLRTIEQVLMLARRILQTCPYPGCYSKFTLPVYSCSTCGAKHRHLRPDLDGAFWHVCQCGTRLPTTILLGRFRLQAHCPRCDRRLPTRIGRVRIEPVPLVGGPDAGKTTFMALTVDALHGAVTAAGGTVLFADEGDEAAFRQLRRELAAGKISKTLPDLPRAVMLDITLPGGSEKGSRILYLFDPSGEHYTGASKVEEMHYLAHGEALILVIDPFALPAVQDHLLESESRLLKARGVILSREDPADTFTRLRNELAGRSDGGRQRRVAVVLTKADLLESTTSGRGVKNDLPGWLTLMGLGNLVRELRNQGVQTRYLTSGLPPVTAQVVELFGWLTGLRLKGDPAAVTTAELTAGDARRPWDAKARPEGRLPLSYLISRRGIAAITVALSTTVIVMLSLLMLTAWIPGGSSAGRPASPAVAVQVPAPSSAPAAFAGHWTGPVDQPGAPAFTMDMVLRAGRRTVTFGYPELGCSGSATVHGDGGFADRIHLFEAITDDPRNKCQKTVWASLTRTAGGRLDVRLYINPGSSEPFATAVLVRR